MLDVYSGSPNRRALPSIDFREPSHDLALYPIMSSLRQMDMTVGSQEEAVDFDAKHLAKRLRNQLLSTMFTVNEVALTRTDLSKMLSLAAEDSKHSIEQLTNP